MVPCRISSMFFFHFHLDCFELFTLSLVQYVDSLILVTVNDCQYVLSGFNKTLNSYDLSNVQLFLGGLPVTGSLVSGLYPSLTQVNTFSGCIRNVMSNGYYLDMNAAVTSAHSETGQCSSTWTTISTTTTTTTTVAGGRATNIMGSRFTWLLAASILCKVYAV